MDEVPRNFVIDDRQLQTLIAAGPHQKLQARNLHTNPIPVRVDVAVGEFYSNPRENGEISGAQRKRRRYDLRKHVLEANAYDSLLERHKRNAGADITTRHTSESTAEKNWRVYGADNFPGSVLADVGVDRPAAQRFTDKPFVEVGISEADLADSADLSIADGDIIYISFASAEAKERATEVMDGDAWRRVSAHRDNRVFAVNNEVWQTGGGIVAARGILADLRWVNAPIN